MKVKVQKCVLFPKTTGILHVGPDKAMRSISLWLGNLYWGTFQFPSEEVNYSKVRLFQGLVMSYPLVISISCMIPVLVQCCIVYG